MARMKKLPNDPKDRGLNAHAFAALAAFGSQVEGARTSMQRGYGFYGEAYKELVDATIAALPFIDADTRQGVEDALRFIDQAQAFEERKIVGSNLIGAAYEIAAHAIIDLTVGVPEEYETRQRTSRIESEQREAEWRAKYEREREEKRAAEEKEKARIAAGSPVVDASGTTIGVVIATDPASKEEVPF